MEKYVKISFSLLQDIADSFDYKNELLQTQNKIQLKDIPNEIKFIKDHLTTNGRTWENNLNFHRKEYPEEKLEITGLYQFPNILLASVYQDSWAPEPDLSSSLFYSYDGFSWKPCFFKGYLSPENDFIIKNFIYKNVLYIEGSSLLRSEDGGITWSEQIKWPDKGIASNEIWNYKNFLNIKIKNDIFVADFKDANNGGYGIIYSNDYGKTWEKTNAWDTGAYKQNPITDTIEYDPKFSKNDAICSHELYNDTFYCYVHRRGLYKSMDGITWTKIDSINTNLKATLKKIRKKLYLIEDGADITSDITGYVLTSNGQWNRITDSTFLTNAQKKCHLYYNSDDNITILISKKGIIYSKDEGENWEKTEYSYNSDLKTLIENEARCDFLSPISYLNGTYFFVAQGKGILYYSGDGVSWKALKDKNITCIYYYNGRHFLGTKNQGILYSDDNLQTFKSSNATVREKEEYTYITNFKGTYIALLTPQSQYSDWQYDFSEQKYNISRNFFKE